MRFLILFFILFGSINYTTYGTLSFLKKNFIPILLLTPCTLIGIFFIMNHRIMFSRQNNMRSLQEQEQEDQYNKYIRLYKEKINELLTPERQDFLKKIEALMELKKLQRSYDCSFQEKVDEIRVKTKELFSQKNLSLLYFLMITQKNIREDLVQSIDSLLRINNHHNLWKNLVEIFISCGPKYQKKFFKYYSKFAFPLMDGGFGYTYRLFLTYDVLVIIKNNIDCAKKNQCLVKLHHVETFLNNYIILNEKNAGFCWNKNGFFMHPIQVPLWRIGKTKKKNDARFLCEEFMGIIDWLDQLLETAPELKKSVCTQIRNNNTGISFKERAYEEILWNILYNIDPHNSPHHEWPGRHEVYIDSKQDIENFDFILKKLDTKTHNKFFINLLVTQLRNRYFRDKPERYKQFYDLLYHIAQHVNFKKEENWKIILNQAQNKISIKSDYFYQDWEMNLFQSRSITEDFLSETQRIFINSRWKNFLEVVDENDCMIPPRLPKIAYQYNQGYRLEGSHS